MASNPKVEIENLITCILCLEPFVDPRLVPCSHTYCYKCINQMSSANGHQFECPLRDGCTILKQDIDSLPLNRAIRDLVELHSSVQGSNKCTSCHLAVAEYSCDKCENEIFCSECYQKEHTSRIMQKHQRLPLGSNSSRLSLCRVHLDEKLKYWCHKCNVVICRDCLLFEHKDHEYALINDVAKGLETKVTIHLQAIQSSLEYRMRQAEILLNTIDNDSTSCRLNITEIMRSLRNSIDECEKAILKQISMTEATQKKKCEDYKILVTNELQNLRTQRVTFEILLASKNNSKLLQAKQGFDDYIKKTNGTVKSFQMPTRTEYYLEADASLQSLTQAIGQCIRYVEIPSHRNLQLEKSICDNQENHELNLQSQGLTDSDMKIVADALRTSTTLTELDLRENQIGQQGAQYIADALKINQTLTRLRFGQNQIGEQGAQHIADALKVNQTLTVIGLGQNEIGQQGAQHIADALKINQTFTSLYLRGNGIGQQGVQYIADALKINQTLITLDLEQNEIGPLGAQYIADALKTNKTLTVLGLRQNKIEQYGAQNIADALKVNQTLTRLGLEENEIDEHAINRVQETLRTRINLTVNW